MPGAQPKWRFQMRTVAHCMLVVSALAAGLALAKMPPPTPEEQAAAAAKKAKQAQQTKEEKAALERAQDRVVQHYKKDMSQRGSSAGSGSRQKTEEADMPKTTRELPGSVGPRPSSPPSAEAHSAPAK
jgi:hypothetical protein